MLADLSSFIDKDKAARDKKAKDEVIQKLQTARSNADALARSEERNIDIDTERLQLIKEGLARIQKDYFATARLHGSKANVPPQIYDIQKNLRTSLVATLGNIVGSQARLLQTRKELACVDRSLFAQGVASCTLCGTYPGGCDDDEEGEVIDVEKDDNKADDGALHPSTTSVGGS